MSFPQNHNETHEYINKPFKPNFQPIEHVRVVNGVERDRSDLEVVLEALTTANAHLNSQVTEARGFTERLRPQPERSINKSDAQVEKELENRNMGLIANLQAQISLTEMYSNWLRENNAELRKIIG